MDILTHGDSSVIGSFATDIPKRCVSIELSEPKNAKAVLLVNTSEPILYSKVDGTQLLPLILDANLFSFLSELAKQKRFRFALPLLIEKAALLVKNPKSTSTSAQFYLTVAGEGLSETLEFRAEKVTLESNL
jgi:hypothetical protein